MACIHQPAQVLPVTLVQEVWEEKAAGQVLKHVDIVGYFIFAIRFVHCHINTFFCKHLIKTCII